MELITYNTNNGNLNLLFHGRLDSSNASEAELGIIKIRKECRNSNIVIDADDLEYVSSAGLRVILRLLKEVPTLKIINVSSGVYDIFEMTGFTEMLQIEKAYRKISIEGCEVIGKGANGKVYRLDPETVVKVYANIDALPDIHRERELARLAFIKGIPTAISYDVVKVGDKFGSVFELLNADSLANAIAKNPEKLDEYMKVFVDLLKIIHSSEVKEPDLPSQKQIALNWTSFLEDYLPEKVYNKIYSLVNSVPEDNHILHGDYHMKNVLFQNNEPLLIDMDTLARGNKIFEFASAYNALIGFYDITLTGERNFLGIPHYLEIECWKKLVEMYFNTNDPKVFEEISDKCRLMGFIRLLRRSIRRGALETEFGLKQVDYIKSNIIELASKIDDLAL